MEVIKNGNEVKCPTCGAVLRFSAEDLHSDPATETFSVKCPNCDEKIDLGYNHYLIRVYVEHTTDLEMPEPVCPMAQFKTLRFVDNNQKNRDKIGAGHQILGITHKGKYMLGNTYLHKHSGKILDTMYYAKKIAKLD